MLGDKIRMYRKDKGLKLTDMAKLAGLSISYISQLERNLIEPSLSSLRKISTSLEVPIYLLMEDGSEENLVTKKEERTKISIPNSNFSYEVVSVLPENRDVQVRLLAMYFYLEADGHFQRSFSMHSSEELIIVTKGSIEVKVGEKSHLLQEGDSIYIMEDVPHSIINIGEERAEGYFIETPPYLPTRSR